MSNPAFMFFVLNGITGAAFMFYTQYIENYISNEIKHKDESINDEYLKQEKKIEYLCNKICKLESTIFQLQQALEDMEEKFIKKENALIQSNCELNTKLEDFIQYNYDMLDE